MDVLGADNETFVNWTFVGEQETGLTPHLGLSLKVSYVLVCSLGLVINLILLAAIIGEGLKFQRKSFSVKQAT